MDERYCATLWVKTVNGDEFRLVIQMRDLQTSYELIKKQLEAIARDWGLI